MLHEPGIYYFMPKEVYHADDALGSSNIREILKSPRDFWLGSPMNPDRALYQREETKATVVGDAIHSYLLDGLGDFHDRYVRRPDDPPGASPSDKAQVTKKFNASLSPHQTKLHGDEWRIVETAGNVITSHPDLGGLFDGGDHEVSVFWDGPAGIRLKCRFDILKPRGIADIKSIANQYGDRLDIAAKFAIKRLKYHIQAAHYLEGRRHLPGLFKQEKVFLYERGEIKQITNGSIGTVALIYNRLRECAKAKEFAFQFVFVSKARPTCWACILSPDNPMIEIADAKIVEALETYHQALREFGTAKPWPEIWQLGELFLEDMPSAAFGWD
jgi:hypothetical protein